MDEIATAKYEMPKDLNDQIWKDYDEFVKSLDKLRESYQAELNRLQHEFARQLAWITAIALFVCMLLVGILITLVVIAFYKAF